ncbi:MAG: TlpA family protein disulfide reductase [Actinomycetes bacterium]
MIAGVAALAAVLVAGTAFGLLRRRRDGRVRAVASADQLTPADLGSALGERATLVQFTTAFCAPCRTTRVVLNEVTGLVDGVRYVDIDAESNLGLVRRLDVRRTPTVLVLDAKGRIANRASGAPRKADLLAALSAVV